MSLLLQSLLKSLIYTVSAAIHKSCLHLVIIVMRSPNCKQFLKVNQLLSSYRIFAWKENYVLRISTCTWNICVTIYDAPVGFYSLNPDQSGHSGLGSHQKVFPDVKSFEKMRKLQIAAIQLELKLRKTSVVLI